MQKIRQEESSHQLEHSQTKVDTPDSLVHNGEAEIQRSASSKAWICNIKRCAFIFMILLSSSLLISYTNSQGEVHVVPITRQTATKPDKFNFLVYCPQSYRKIAMPEGVSEQLRRRLLVPSEFTDQIQQKNIDSANPLNLSRTFHVEVRSLEYKNQSGQINVQLFYCGIVRDFYQTCDEAYIACSSPGPMFDIPAREHIDVVWINKLNSSFVPPFYNDCMNSTYSSENQKYCTLMGKVQKQQTYYDPTQPLATDPPMKNMTISKQNWPMTTHVHGAEIRPTFDGNPLSWIDNTNINDGKVEEGHLGMGTLSIDDKCYYESFQSIDSKSKQSYLPPSISVNDQSSDSSLNKSKSMFKINRYPNLQNPGMLWYHDHAMHLTNYSVANGLSGFFILRDKQVEQKLNIPRQYEKLVMFTVNGLAGQTKLHQLQHSTVYRFRFLNNNFNGGGNNTLKVSFSYGNCQDDYDKRENMTIIGADSSLFNESLDYQTSFVLTQAQRIEVLVVFDQFINKTTRISICGDKNIIYGANITFKNHPNMPLPKSNTQENKQQILNAFSFYGIQIVNPTHKAVLYQNITKLILDVPFTNLSKVQDSQIAVKRMRPLIRMGGKTFTINGRRDFHQGRSENPTIGTIQDWFFINTMSFGHPIHVHLINFQVIGSYNVRIAKVGDSSCALYELEFILTAIKKYPDARNRFPDVFIEDGYNYTYLCQNRSGIQNNESLAKYFNEIFPEDQIDKNSRISGINTMVKIRQIPSFNKTNYDNLTLDPPITQQQWSDPNLMLYVVPNLDLNYKPYYRRWKDTAYVDGFKMLHYRMRWTKSNYTEKEDKPRGTYFHVPAGQLIEYPGYVYHCHILSHEDNEMMRPIMLQLPQDYPLDPNITCNYKDGKLLLKWADKYRCINERCRNATQ